VRELIDIKNRSENRTGDLRVDGTMAFGIDLEQIVEKDLLLPGLNLNKVPTAGERILITKKFTPETGNDIIVVTDQTHPENKKLFLRVAEILGADIVGMDVVCEDITKAYTEQTFAIIETNSIPYTNVHQYPSEGKAEPVAQMVWDMVLARL
jgi:cyanophycin synthetase